MNAITSPNTAPESQPAYLQIKSFVLDKIQSGEWQEGHLIPTELALCDQFSVSRMTVNRALRELSNDGLLVRIKGSGTYVAQPKYQSTLIEIRSIAQDIRERGHIHSSKVLSMERLKATAKQAKAYDIRTGTPLFRSIIVHLENDIPIQYEDRFVDATRAPDYLDQNWDIITPNEYLTRVAPLPKGFYTIEVQMPTEAIAAALSMKPQDPCLVLNRTTYSGGNFTSFARMWHPGDRYKFAGLT